MPESFLSENGVRNANGAVQGVVNECGCANFLHLTPCQSIDSTLGMRRSNSIINLLFEWQTNDAPITFPNALKTLLYTLQPFHRFPAISETGQHQSLLMFRRPKVERTIFRPISAIVMKSKLSSATQSCSECSEDNVRGKGQVPVVQL